MTPTGSPSGAPACTRPTVRTPWSHRPAISSVVSYSERRDSRLIPASVFPWAARAAICRRAGSVIETGSTARWNVTSFVGKRRRSCLQSSLRWRPSSSTGLSAMPRSEGSAANGFSSSKSKRPSPHRKRS